MSILIYFLFFLCAFLLGFFGLAPILILDLLSEKMPYIILVILGYTTLIVLFVLWQNGYLDKFQNKDEDQEEYYDDEDVESEQDVETAEESEEYLDIQTVEEFHQKVEELMEKVEGALEEQGIEVIKEAKTLEESIAVQEEEGNKPRVSQKLEV